LHGLISLEKRGKAGKKVLAEGKKTQKHRNPEKSGLLVYSG
jgi:hypothetical protein